MLKNAYKLGSTGSGVPREKLTVTRHLKETKIVSRANIRLEEEIRASKVKGI